jgi:uncharacterized damage-inducible protein DinB
MKATDIIKLNFEEVRRRSLIIWEVIPQAFWHWRPDANAMTCLQMIRHVLEGEHLFHQIITNRGNLGNYQSPWINRPCIGVKDEVQFAMPFRTKFIETITNFTGQDLELIEINRSEKGQKRKLGDYLNRIAYHESVHAGQMLSYLRQLQLERPLVWD